MVQIVLPFHCGGLLTSPLVSMATWKVDELCGLRVVYRDSKEGFNGKLEAFKAAGKKKLQVISDFDFTLSRYFQKDGESRSSSCHMVLERYKGLPSNYQTKAQALQEHYHPIEMDMSLPKEEKYQHMARWANSANGLLKEGGLTKDILKDAVTEAMNSGRFSGRDGLKDLIELLIENQIPLLLFSAGIANVLEHCILRTLHPDAGENELERMNLTTLYDKVNVISNRALWDENGNLVEFSQPVLHVLNKSCTDFIETNPHFKLAADCTKLFLFGDSLGDLKMSIGLDHLQKEDILRIGFLNAKEYEDLLPIYLAEDAYDLVILDDPSVAVQQHLIQTVLD